jgi:exopolysaccharide production protein ExoQ
MLKTLEKIYAVIALLFLAGGMIPTDMVQGETSPAYTRALIIGQLCVFGILAVLASVHWRKMLHGVRSAFWPLILSGMAVASAAWSLDPAFTLRRAVLLLASTLFAIFLASCFEWEEQFDIFALTTVLAVFGSYLLVALLPNYGVSHDMHWGNWKGLFPHKNVMGLYMGFGILLLCFAKPRGLPKWLRIATIIGAAGLLIFSGSITALVATLFCFAAYPLVRLFIVKRKNTLPLWIPILPLFVLAGLFLVLNSDSILALLGRDSTLTGRPQLWAVSRTAIREYPIFGHGYSAFWHMATFESTGVAIAPTTHAHDGYLDLCLDLGLVGLFIFAISFFTMVKRALAALQEKSIDASKWPVIFLLFFSAYNITESCILRPHTFLWVPYVSVYVFLALAEAKQPSAEYESALIPDYSS